MIFYEAPRMAKIARAAPAPRMENMAMEAEAAPAPMAMMRKGARGGGGVAMKKKARLPKKP